MDIGVVIKKYRKEAGMTQEEMANRLGVTTPAVNKWENSTTKAGITASFFNAPNSIIYMRCLAY